MEDPDDIVALRLQLATERRQRELAETHAADEAKKRELAEVQAADEAKKRELAEAQVDQRDSYIGVLQTDNRRLRCERWDRLRRRSCLSDYRALRHLYSMR